MELYRLVHRFCSKATLVNIELMVLVGAIIGLPEKKIEDCRISNLMSICQYEYEYLF